MKSWMVGCFCAALVLFGFGCRGGLSQGALEGDLLFGKSPVSSRSIEHPERLTDGEVDAEGGFWQTRLTSVFSSPDGQIIFDLGETKAIDTLVIQGDANDRYQVDGSLDGRAYEPLFSAAEGRSGMQTRSASGLGRRARYLKLTADGGDQRYSVGEFAAFESRTTPLPAFQVTNLEQAGTGVRSGALWFGIFGVLFAALFSRNHRLSLLLGLVPLAALLWAAWNAAILYPLDEGYQTLIRAVVAAVALAVVIREWFSFKNLSPYDRRLTLPLLSLLAVLAVGCYYHFGRPQFSDESKGRPTLVHPWDMRVYFPVAKYFHELRYDGLYLASVAAYLDNHPEEKPEAVADVKMRSLQNNLMVKAGEIMPEIQAVRQRFSPSRWQLFCQDMAYFEGVMGKNGYLGSLRDHGGNATPVWLLSAWLLFQGAPANELTLTLAGLLDPLLLAGLFVVVARTFGVRAMLVTVIAWGTTDFSRFGTNLMGSTLRADWMVALGLGVCALAVRRWATGGALLAYAGLIRGFPAVAGLALAGPPLFWLIDRFRKTGKLPLFKEILSEQAGFLRAACGGLACVVALVIASSAVFSFQGSWGAWQEKIKIHQEKPNVNHVGLRNVVSYEAEHVGQKVIRDDLDEPWTDWQTYQLNAFSRRAPLYYSVIALAIAAVLLASRRWSLAQAALAGTCLIPFFFYPANYYCHYIFLLPLVGAVASRTERQPALFAWGAMVVLATSVATYPTLDAGWSDQVFTQQSWVLLAGMSALLFPFVVEGWDAGLLGRTEALAWLSQGPQPEEAGSTDLAPEGGRPRRRRRKGRRG